MNSTNQTDLCTISSTIIRFPFALILSMEIVFGIISIPPNILLVIALFKAKVYPANLRYLLVNLSTGLMGFSCANTLKCMITLIDGLNDSCKLIINAFTCALIGIPASILSSIAYYSFLSISLERLYCVIKYRRSDYSSSKPTISFIFLAIMWIATLAPIAQSLLMAPGDQYLAICESSIYVKGADVLKPMLILTAVEIVPIILIVLVYSYDRYNIKNTAINRVQYKLNFRFQLIQSAQMNAILIPSLILHAICYMPTMILYFVLLYRLDMGPAEKWRYFHACTIYRLIYACVHPILAFRRNRRLLGHLKFGSFGRMSAKVANAKCVDLKNASHRPNQQRSTNQIREHFNILESVWAAGPTKNR